MLFLLAVTAATVALSPPAAALTATNATQLIKVYSDGWLQGNFSETGAQDVKDEATCVGRCALQLLDFLPAHVYEGGGGHFCCMPKRRACVALTWVVRAL